MIEFDILKSLIINSENLAEEAINKYGLTKCVSFINKSKTKNHFLRLVKGKNKEIDNYLSTTFKFYKQRACIAKNLSKELNSAGIRHVFFKGAAISTAFSDNQSDRPYRDFDILIDAEDLRDFYSFLDAKSLEHNNNFRFLNRSGYTRTALEVIQDKSGIVYDFHYRIMSKFYKKQCLLSKSMLNDANNYSDLMIPSRESLISSSSYHCFVQNNSSITPQLLCDLNLIMQYKIDSSKIKKQLNNKNLFEKIEKVKTIIEDMHSDQNNNKLKALSKKLFKNEFERNSIFKPFFLPTQIAHFFDPEPYINYAGGDLTRNGIFELLKTKFRRKQLRNL